MLKKLLLLLFTNSMIYAQNVEFLKEPFIKQSSNITENSTLPKGIEDDLIRLKEHISHEYYFDDKDLHKVIGYYTRSKIMNSEGVESAGNVIIPGVSKEYLKYAALRVYQPDGSNKSYGVDDFIETDEDGYRLLKYAIENLKVGCEIELIYLYEANLGLWGSHVMDNDNWTGTSYFEIIAPSNLIFKAKTSSSENEIEFTSDSLKNKWQLTLKDLPKYKPEKYSLEDYERPRFDYTFHFNSKEQSTTIQTWDKIGVSVMNALLRQRDESSKFLQKIVKSERLNEGNTLQKVRKIENYIKSNINIERDSPAASLTESFKNRYTNYFGAQQLYAVLFKLCDIPFHTIVTNDKSAKQIESDLVSWAFVNDIFYYIPDIDAYLSPTNAYRRIGLLEKNYTDANALFIEEVNLGGAISYVTEIKKIKEPNYEQNADYMEIDLTLNEDNSKAIFSYLRSFDGQMIDDLKGYYMVANAEQRKAFGTNIFKSFLFDGIEVTDFSVENFDLNTEEWYKPLVFKSKFETDLLVQKVGPKIFLKVGDLIGQQVEMYAEEERKTQINTQNQHGYLRKIHVKIPEGYRVINASDINLNVVCKSGDNVICDFVSTYTLSDNMLEIKIDETYRQSSIAKEFYTDFQKVINASADWNKVVLVFEKK